MGDDKVKKRVFSYILFDITHIDKELIGIYFHFLTEKINSYLRSHLDLSSESFFWRRLYHEHRIKRPNEILYPRGDITKKSIIFGLNKIKTKYSETILCLDCGCGPTSQFFTNDFIDRSDIKIITVDPLSEVYKELHRKYKTGYDLVCIPGYGECLDELFPKGFFHLVYSQNAIDHSQDPKKFLEMLNYVLKPNGYLILHGFIKEGSAANWLGLHKWDIETTEGHLLLSNRNGQIKKLNLTRQLNLKVHCKSIDGQKIGDRYTIIYEKIEVAP